MCRRSTPAHAGNTVPPAVRARSWAVYPRPRGEYENTDNIIRNLQGLPPPTRGIQHQVVVITDAGRSTPAHAGNTPSAGGENQRKAVYPRPRGEYVMANDDEDLAQGLPPPTRGIPMGTAVTDAFKGSTPAHAGNTI